MNIYSNGSNVSISNYLDQNNFFIDYCDQNSNINFSVYVNGYDVCNVTFQKNSTYGRFEIKNSELSSLGKIVFDEYFTSDENPIDKDVFATECSEKLNDYMLSAQNEIFLSKLGVGLSDFGFVGY